MSGHSSPLTCCDSDCAGINHCRIGGYQCESCGCWFCGDEVNEDGLCDDCANRREEEEAEEEGENK